MSEKHNVAWGQSAPVLATAAALWISGVVALPLIFGSQPAGIGSGLVWLAVAVAITIVLLALMPSLARLLAAALARLSAALASPDAPSSATFKTAQLLVVARLMVLAAELLIVQAVLRRPIAIVLGGERQVATVEAGIAAGALILILPLLAWTYQTTRPLIQAATLRALDAAIPTIGTVALAEPATRGSHVVVPPTARRATTDARTLAATDDGDQTAVSQRAAARRMASTPADDDATEVASPGGDKALIAADDDDQTVVSPRDGDKTFVSPHDRDKTFVSPPRGDDPRTRGA